MKLRKVEEKTEQNLAKKAGQVLGVTIANSRKAVDVSTEGAKSVVQGALDLFTTKSLSREISSSDKASPSGEKASPKTKAEKPKGTPPQSEKQEVGNEHLYEELTRVHREKSELQESSFQTREAELLVQLREAHHMRDEAFRAYEDIKNTAESTKESLGSEKDRALVDKQELTETVGALKNELTEARAGLDLLKAEARAKDVEFDSTQQKLKETQDALAQLQAERDKGQSESDNRVCSLEEERDQLASELTRKKALIMDQECELLQLRGDLSEISTALESVKYRDIQGSKSQVPEAQAEPEPAQPEPELAQPEPEPAQPEPEAAQPAPPAAHPAAAPAPEKKPAAPEPARPT
ncbi:MAG: hypothetical protein HQL32_09050, partial [Planctomycetes bacterium]|nr:hypothetical protein [Planctomycetota bacterium]